MRQVYQKEKIREKKSKIDCTNKNLDYIRNNAGDYHYKLFNSLEEYLHLCEKYEIRINFKNATIEDVKSTFKIIKERQSKEVLLSKKKNHKKDLFNTLAEDGHKAFTQFLGSQAKVKAFFKEKESTIKVVIAPFEKNKKRFLKSLTVEQVAYLFRIVEHEFRWKRNPTEYVFKSKNLNQSIADYMSFVLFEYETTRNERLLAINKRLFDVFLWTNSFIKAIKEINNAFPLTKKQISRLKEYKFFTNKIEMSQIKKEFFIYDLVNDKNVVKTLMAEQYSETFVKYCFYLKNRVFKDNFFEHSQAKPLYDYILHKKRIMQQEGKTFYLEHYEPYVLLTEMEQWHKTLHKINTGQIKSWEASAVISGLEEVRVKDPDIGITSTHNFSIVKIEELNNNAELLKEGKAMRHCVGSYAKRCAQGQSRIFSLRKKSFSCHNLKSYVTIEVRNENEIIQARGFGNKMVSGDDKNIICKWARDNGVSWHGY